MNYRPVLSATDGGHPGRGALLSPLNVSWNVRQLHVALL